jgi:hypothetical protein
MKGKYRIYVLGSVPSDLREQISSLHVTALIKGQNVRVEFQTQDFKNQNRKTIGSGYNGVRH